MKTTIQKFTVDKNGNKKKANGNTLIFKEKTDFAGAVIRPI